MEEKDERRAKNFDLEGDFRGYQIVGTWSGRRPEPMACSDETYSFTVTLGENRWESSGGLFQHEMRPSHGP